MKVMRVVLEIDVEDITDELRRECIEGGMDEADMPTLANTTADEAASVLEDPGAEEVFADCFPGSDVYVRFVRSEVISAEWVPEQVGTDAASPAREAGRTPNPSTEE